MSNFKRIVIQTSDTTMVPGKIEWNNTPPKSALNKTVDFFSTCHTDSYLLCGVEQLGKGAAVGLVAAGAVITAPVWGPAVATSSSVWGPAALGAALVACSDGDNAHPAILDPNSGIGSDTRLRNPDGSPTDAARNPEDMAQDAEDSATDAGVVADVADVPDSDIQPVEVALNDSDGEGTPDILKDVKDVAETDDGGKLEDSDANGKPDILEVAEDVPEVVQPPADAEVLEDGVQPPPDTTTDTPDAEDVAPEATTDAPDQDSTPDGIPPPPNPSCVAVKETVSCEAGSKKVAFDYMVKGATKVICDSQPTVDIADPTTSTVISIYLPTCATTTIDDNCKAINDITKAPPAQCPAGTIKAITLPKNPPQLKNLMVANPIPSGNGCIGQGNTITASWSGVDPENQPLTCQIKVSATNTGKEVVNIALPPQASGPNMTAQIPTDNMLKVAGPIPGYFVGYSGSITCTDPDGLSATLSAASFFTIHHKNTRLWYRFMDGVGNKVTDSSPSKLDGQVVGIADWVVNGGINLNGNTHISVPKAPFFKSMNELSLLISFTPSSINQINSTVLFDVTNPAKTNRYTFEIQPKGFPEFFPKVSGALKYVLTGSQPIMLGLNTMMATHDSSGAALFNWIKSAWQSVASNADYTGPLTTDSNGTVTIGCLGDGTYCYQGLIQEVIVVENNLLAACK